MLVLYLVLVAGLAVSESSACMCFANHIQNVLCDGRDGAVFKGKVDSKSESAERGYRTNNIIIKDVYKDTSSSLRVGETVEVKTPTEASLCIIDLQEEVTYLIDATYYDDEFKTNGCAVTNQWPIFATDSAMLSKSLANPDCSCSVRVCEHPMAGPDMYFWCLTKPTSDDECIMDKYASDACATKYRGCQGIDGKCGWKPALSGDCENLLY